MRTEQLFLVLGITPKSRAKSYAQWMISLLTVLKVKSMQISGTQANRTHIQNGK